MFDRLDADFANLLAGTPRPETVYECKASYRDSAGTVHHTTGRIAGPSREAALEDFLIGADDEYEGCTRVSQTARIAPKE